MRAAASPAPSAVVAAAEEQLSTLVGAIYDAALEPGSWPQVLGEIAAFTGAQVAGLLSKDSVSRAGNVHYDNGTDAAFLDSYRDKYWRYDPLAPLLYYEAGEVVVATRQMGEREFREGRFYREWLKPQGWIDSANVVLDKSVTSCAILSVVRKEPHPPVDDEMIRRVQLLIPHVRRAVLIGRLVDLKSGQADAFADVFDRLSAAMFLLEADGNIVHSNVPGAAMLAAGSVLSPRRGRLMATDPVAGKQLEAGLDIINRLGGLASASGLSVPLAALDDERYLAHLLPLNSGARRRAGRHYAAVAALFVHPTALDVPEAPAVIAKTFALTITELRLLMAIVNIGGVPETAEALGVADTTVKTHLHRVFAKTGTSRQADLVKLVAGFAGPLAP